MDISESFRKNENAPLPRKVASRLLRMVAPGLRTAVGLPDESAAGSRRAPRPIGSLANGWPAAVDVDEPGPSSSALAEETANLKREVGRLVNGLFGPENGPATNALAAKLRRFAKS